MSNILRVTKNPPKILIVAMKTAIPESKGLVANEISPPITIIPLIALVTLINGV